MTEKNVSRDFTPFLKMVADDLTEKYGSDLSNYVAVFPNKRARLFMNEWLALHGTVWAPRCLTVSELFRSFSDVTINDPIDTVCRIYDSYRRITKSNETLDSFYGWGERLLSDFDDADKNMADVKSLFTNVRDYKSIDFGDFLNEDEKKAVESFFGNFDDSEKSHIRENFMLLWNHMLPIYQDLNKKLTDDGLAYEGALYRRIVEKLEIGEITLPEVEDTNKWIFVGFNVLDAVEHRLMSLLKDRGRAVFYWDYDEFYVTEDMSYEAGEFLRKNLNDFPNELPASNFRVMGIEQEFEFVAAPTENAQAFSTTQWVRDNLTDDAKRTAIVICNENLLEPVLHSLPSEVKEINVTKGFPLSHTSEYSKLLKFLDEADMEKLKNTTSEYLGLIQLRIKDYAKESEVSQDGSDGYDTPYMSMLSELNAEVCFRIYTMIERLSNIARKDYFNVSHQTLRKLILQLARQTDIPFHGEPAAGLQVMGVLETRNLDFENILILSANEGMIPKNTSDNSFIPYPLKKAFGLTLTSRRNAVYAYYFFRLIQRAKKVRFVYNCTADAYQTGEMSRYMMQLLISRKFNIKHFMLSSKLKEEPSRQLSVRKSAEMLDKLLYKDDGTEKKQSLSPSSINYYLDCQLKFYFHRIAGLRKPQDDERDIDDKDFGNLFHDAAEIYYRKAKERGVDDYKTFNGNVLGEKDDSTLRRCINEAREKHGFPREVIAEETVLGYLKKLLKADGELGNLRIIDLETDKFIRIPVRVGEQTKEILVGGRIDRLDVATNPDEPDTSKARTLRVVDYKTGKKVHEAKTVEDIFFKTPERPYYLFQAFLYALTLEQNVKEICGEDIPVSTVLFYPSQFGKKDYSAWIKFAGKPLSVFSEEIKNEFYELLVNTLEEIVNPDIPFKATDNEKACNHCDFRILCGKRDS